MYAGSLETDLSSGRYTYRELGVNYFDQQRPETMTKRLVKRLEQLGHRVTLESQPTTQVVSCS